MCEVSCSVSPAGLSNGSSLSGLWPVQFLTPRSGDQAARVAHFAAADYSPLYRRRLHWPRVTGEHDPLPPCR